MAIHDVPGGQPSSAANVAQLKQSLADLIEESQALRNDVHDAERARKKASLVSMMVLIALCVPMIMLVILVWQNNMISQDVRKTNEVIVDCTTPGGKCAAQSSKRTGDAIGDIIRANIFMAECARLYPGEVGPEFDRKLEACVYGRLAAAAAERSKASPPPSPSPSVR